MAKQTITFFSMYTGYELVRQPKHDVPVPSGIGWINSEPGVRYRFQPAIDESGKLVGRLDVTVGQDVLQDTMGWLAPDQDQDVKRDAPDALRAHREYGREFWAMKVPSASVRAAIRKALANLDEEALVALIEQERAETPRADLVSEAEDALLLVREQMASLRAQAEAAEAERAAAKPKAKAKAEQPA